MSAAHNSRRNQCGQEGTAGAGTQLEQLVKHANQLGPVGKLAQMEELPTTPSPPCRVPQLAPCTQSSWTKTAATPTETPE